LKYWKIIAGRLSEKGWNWAISEAPDDDRMIYIVDALSANGRRFVVRSDQLLTAFIELERESNGAAVK
jgi:hypothetical protein